MTGKETGSGRKVGLEASVKQRLGDLLDEEGIEAALLSVAYGAIAARHAPSLTRRERELIRLNFPAVTNDLLDERAIDDEGLVWVVSLATMLLTIGVDFNPRTNVTDMVETDRARGMPGMSETLGLLAEVWKKAIAAGMTPYGAFASIVLRSMREARSSGLHWGQVVRALAETIQHAAEPKTSRAPAALDKEDMRRAVRALAWRLGVSETTARKYAKDALERIRGDFEPRKDN